MTRANWMFSKFAIILIAISLQNQLVTVGAATEDTVLNVEEQRLTKVSEQLPEVLSALNVQQSIFSEALNSRSTKQPLMALVTDHGHRLWQAAVDHIRDDVNVDDRPLYWQRLAFRKHLKQHPDFRSLTQNEQDAILWQFELSSRGQRDAVFQSKTPIKILITGFDPFFLDRHLGQSNPSGVTALLLDNQIIDYEGQQAEIQSLLIPVRYADFDQGMIETLLAPYYGEVDMIATISMGRQDFDLERFPGLRRSAEAPDNLNDYTGANKTAPLKPFLRGEALDGPEFVEFSLPVASMQQAKGKFQIIDNHNVSTLTGAKTPASLIELANEISVSGSGGGYLSNEISYRSIRLRNYLNPELPVGHIHTPRIQAFEPETSRAIAEQIKSMLQLSLEAL